MVICIVSLKRYLRKKKQNHRPKLYVTLLAANQGNIPFLSWLLKQGYPYNARALLPIHDFYGKPVSNLMKEAIRSGSVECVEFVLNSKLGYSVPPNAARLAGRGCVKDVNVLRYLHANKVRFQLEWDERICKKAAVAGNLNALKFSHEETGLALSKVSWEDVVRYCRTEILQYGISKSPDIASPALARYAFKEHSFNCSMVIHHSGIPFALSSVIFHLIVSPRN